MNKKFIFTDYDNTNREVIVKIISRKNTPYNAEINLTNSLKVEPADQLTSLNSAFNKDDSSFDEPNKVSALLNEYSRFSNSFKMEFQPNSFTILRIKASG